MKEEKNNIKKNKNLSPLALFVAMFFVSAFVGAGSGFIGARISDNVFDGGLKGLNEKYKEIRKQEVIQKESAVIDVVEKSSPAVVSIVVTKDVPKLRSFFDDPFGLSPFFTPFQYEDSGETEKQKVGGGTGFFVSKDGLIVTNKHVVSDADAEYTVMTNSGDEYSAKVLARHPTIDVAVIKIEGKDFPVLELGESSELKVGQSVIAIGNSLGEFTNSVSLGIISGLHRDIIAGSGVGETERLNGIIQTDAAINPGNSGGPLLDINGKVIGVNVAVAQGAENVGFALPITEIEKTVKQVESSGKISIPFLGVRYMILDKDIQKENNLKFDYGAIVLRGEERTDLAVVPGSPADKAGIVENDIILEIGGKKVTQKNQLGNIIATYSVGDKVNLKVWHKGEEKNIEVELEARE